MQIKARDVSKYKDIEVTINNTTVELGLHNKDECMELAKTFKEAIYDLLDAGEYKELMEEK